MSSRIFQSVIVQMKEATDRTVGVVDIDKSVVASTDLTLIGTELDVPADLFSDRDPVVIEYNGIIYKPLSKEDTAGYAVFVSGTDDTARTICIMAAIAIAETGLNSEQRLDKRAFVKTIISDNILPGDLFIRANELQFTMEVTRGVLVVRPDGGSNPKAISIIQEIFPDDQSDYVFSVNETDIVIVKEMPAYADTEYLTKLAQTVHEMLNSQLGQDSVIGIGIPSHHLRDISEGYKQALIAIDIWRVFDFVKPVISYENLGISRLIYQLPITLCDIFLSEVFKTNPIEALDEETLLTIDVFFENSLNVSETARKLFVHRNTLVYRLDKIKKITGLDIREFDQAIVFKVALMVKKYLMSQESRF